MRQNTAIIVSNYRSASVFHADTHITKCSTEILYAVVDLLNYKDFQMEWGNHFSFGDWIKLLISLRSGFHL